MIKLIVDHIDQDQIWRENNQKSSSTPKRTYDGDKTQKTHKIFWHNQQSRKTSDINCIFVK